MNKTLSQQPQVQDDFLLREPLAENIPTWNTTPSTRTKTGIEALKDLPEKGRLTITVKRPKNKIEWVVTPANLWQEQTITLSTKETRKHLPVAMSRYMTYVKTSDPNLYRRLTGKNAALAKLVKKNPQADTAVEVPKWNATWSAQPNCDARLQGWSNRTSTKIDPVELYLF